MPKEQFKREVEKELTGRETEAWEIIYFKLYKTQIPVVEQAIETAALMLGTDKSRGYCLEMICADFLAGANLENGNSHILLRPILHFFKFLPGEERRVFLEQFADKASRELHPTTTSSRAARSRVARTTTQPSTLPRRSEMPVVRRDVKS